MEKILIIDNTNKGRKAVFDELKREGYAVRLAAVKAEELKGLDPSSFELAIITLHPDIPSAWDPYTAFKRFFPDSPVLVYLDSHPLENLKSAIKKYIKLNVSPSEGFRAQPREAFSLDPASVSAKFR